LTVIKLRVFICTYIIGIITLNLVGIRAFLKLIQITTCAIVGLLSTKVLKMQSRMNAYVKGLSAVGLEVQYSHPWARFSTSCGREFKCNDVSALCHGLNLVSFSEIAILNDRT
jgi:hypothetical protein